MPHYTPPLDDMGFLLREMFDFDRIMSDTGHADVDADLAMDVLAEGGKFCADVLLPLNMPGDRQGSRLVDGRVITPEGFADAYRAFVAAGWPALSGDPAFGGQGLPGALEVLFSEMLSSANLSFGLIPGLTRGAVEAIAHHASDVLKEAYVPRMISGEWTGAMALTESHAGTDLGLLKARAEPAGDGAYRITGTKIFISSGDHDLADNIVHLVLARLPDAPAGVKGISLFLVPKFLPGADGQAGPRNAMSVGALEHKMGIHAQPTCVMNYDGATGWLVGAPHRGLNAMFTMMNAERLFVGIQGLGIGEAAYQGAQAYARERLQGRSPTTGEGPVAIVAHPDVRRMLLTVRALNEAGRALAVFVALQMDIAAAHHDAGVRKEADGLVALLTPVVKAALTDFGFDSAVLAQQVFGGHGYIAEWGMEQFVRDARITQIYEGTNGVQALDLAGRKLGLDNGAAVKRFIDLMRADARAARRGPAMGPLVEAVETAIDRLETVTRALLDHSADAAWIGAAASDYLRLFALTGYGWLWVKMAAAAQGDSVSARLGREKLALARFFVARLLPQTEALARIIAAGPDAIMDLPDDAV